MIRQRPAGPARRSGRRCPPRPLLGALIGVVGSVVVASAVVGSPIATSPVVGSAVAGSPVMASPVVGSAVAGSPVMASAVAGSAVGSSAVAGSAPAVYEALRQARLEAAGRVDDAVLEVDRVRFELRSGNVFLLEPVEGRITGAVFLGEGRVVYRPPDRVERHQLDKLVDEEILEEEFDRAVLRFTDDTAERLRALISGGGGDLDEARDLWTDRLGDVFEERLFDTDSRVAADLIDDESGWFLAEVDGDDLDWFAVEVEPREREEVRLYRFHANRNVWNTYGGFHSLEAYRAAGDAGAPSSDGQADLPLRPLVPRRERWAPRASQPWVAVDVALEDDGEMEATARLTLEALRPLSSLRLRISTLAEVLEVRRVPAGDDDPPGQEAGARDPDRPRPAWGDPLRFTQRKHDRWMEEDRWEPWLTVALPGTVEAGNEVVLDIAYRAEKLVRRLRDGRYFLRDTQLWYPQHPDARRSRFDLTFRVPEGRRVASSGRLEEDRVQGETRLQRWVVDRPLRAMGFHYGDFEVDEVDPGDERLSEVDLDGLPPITVYSTRRGRGFSPGNRERTIRDLAGSLRLYSEYFGPYPFESLVVSETPALGGQSFGGLLLLSFQTFGAMHTGEAELFRSHETAHQWWGNQIDWVSYRDQWLSEGFAQYAAALYTLLGRDDEERFREMMGAWRKDVMGQVDVAQGLGLRHYGFLPGVIRESDGNESGALVLGHRLNTTETPNDYRLLVYEKGAYVLHMLRMMLLDPETGDDRAFRRLMRGFVARHAGNQASTADFEAAVTGAFGEPMGWFFDQWVYGTGVPTYRPDLEIVATDDPGRPFALRGVIRQEDVGENFRMPVPIRFEFEERAPLLVRVRVDAPEVQVDVPLPARPDDFEVNWMNAVLAEVR